MTSSKGTAGPHDAARWSEGDKLWSSESGVRTISMSDELDRVFETLESGAPPCGLIGVDDPTAESESRALLHQLAREQLSELHQRIEELGIASVQLEPLRLLLDSLGALLEVLQPSRERSPSCNADTAITPLGS